jgi:hypothetical protein
MLNLAHNALPSDSTKVKRAEYRKLYNLCSFKGCFCVHVWVSIIYLLCCKRSRSFSGSLKITDVISFCWIMVSKKGKWDRTHIVHYLAKDFSSTSMSNLIVIASRTRYWPKLETSGTERMTVGCLSLGVFNTSLSILGIRTQAERSMMRWGTKIFELLEFYTMVSRGKDDPLMRCRSFSMPIEIRIHYIFVVESWCACFPYV